MTPLYGADFAYKDQDLEEGTKHVSLNLPNLEHDLVCTLNFSVHIASNANIRLTRAFSSGTSHQSESDSKPSLVKRTPVSRPRVIDARSLGTRHAAPNQSNIIRAPQLRLRRGTLARGRPGAGGARKTGKSRTANAAAANKRTQRRKRDNEEDGEEVGRGNDLEAVFNEVKNASKPKPVRYTPVNYDMTALKDTWPSLPTGKTGSTGTVVERLNLLSRRYGAGYVSPIELAKRLFDGERVFFTGEEEKKTVMAEVSRLAQERADKLTQRKGDLIEPEDSSFASIKDDEKKALVGQIVRGQYEGWQKGDVRHPVLDEVQRQLYNNETYRMTGKQAEFMGKFQSLLASVQRAKRAST
ncbi:conserved hypothetical protein [Talaromyces stipitatus ATCC 10500]|uniref:Uncharacterized protein n=1 Tax=Talaromyces stipitatus (strain ATCC 10500 / CBS 375.48 / QM 6759 / NRRL 1006) TaxID=441959 RepID=B8MHM9_TALSN|nr:uncharacterized protein TSTA_011190 [Talaromyces stipitatus ATCC 10500]EED16010.1 conserved hypothetical protein [Talaromyces stipitatus ATCC 10500]